MFKLWSSSFIYGSVISKMSGGTLPRHLIQIFGDHLFLLEVSGDWEQPLVISPMVRKTC